MTNSPARVATAAPTESSARTAITQISATFILHGSSQTLFATYLHPGNTAPTPATSLGQHLSR